MFVWKKSSNKLSQAISHFCHHTSSSGPARCVMVHLCLCEHEWAWKSFFSLSVYPCRVNTRVRVFTAKAGRNSSVTFHLKHVCGGPRKAMHLSYCFKMSLTWWPHHPTRLPHLLCFCTYSLGVWARDSMRITAGIHVCVFVGCFSCPSLCASAVRIVACGPDCKWARGCLGEWAHKKGQDRHL